MFKQEWDCNLILSNELGPHKAILCILDELSKVDHQTPRERSLGLQSFKQDCADLFLDSRIRFIEENE